MHKADFWNSTLVVAVVVFIVIVTNTAGNYGDTKDGKIVNIKMPNISFLGLSGFPCNHCKEIIALQNKEGRKKKKKEM